MSRVLIVSAYPDSASFGGTLAQRTAERLRAAGHDVAISNLHAQKFRPVCLAEDFNPRANPAFFSLEDEQRHAFLNGTLPLQIKDEQAKLKAADHVLFLCPLYWSGPPAMLRGWLEQVLTPVFAYDRDGKKIFAQGPMTGKTAFFVTTTGSKLGGEIPEASQAKAAAYYTPLLDRPLRYCGFATKETVVVLQPPGLDHPQDRIAALNSAVDTVMAQFTAGATQKPAAPGKQQGPKS